MTDLILGLLTATIIAHLLLGILVLNKKPGILLTRIIFSLSLNAAAWAFAVLMVTLTNNYEQILFWVRASHAAGIMIIWHVYTLSLSFPAGKPLATKYNIMVLLICITLFLSSFSPYLISGLAEPHLSKVPTFSFLFLPYVLTYVGLALYALVRLYKRAGAARGLQKMQLKYLFGGIIISLALSSLANVFLPLLNFSEIAGFDIRPLGPVFSTVMVGSVTYAIIRYRFMDMRLAIRKNMSTVVAILIMVVLLWLFIRFVRSTAIDLYSMGVDFLIILTVLLVLFSFSPFRNLVQKVLDRYLFRKTYDYRTSLLDKIHKLTTLLNLNQLIESLVTEIVRDMDLECGYYYCLVNRKVLYYGAGIDEIAKDDKQCSEFAAVGDNLLKHLEENKDIVLQSDLNKQKVGSLTKQLEKEMSELKIDIVVPMLTGSELEGVIMLGQKMSGEPFFKEDIQLLSFLSSQVTAALKNARLYQDLLDTKRYLERIIANMGNGLIAVDDNGKITVFNSEAASMTGLNSEQALGASAEVLLNEQIYKLYIETLEAGRGRHGVEITLQVGLEKRYLSCNTSLIEFKETGSSEVIIVLGNITRIKELEHEKSQAQRLASLGEMVAGIAHEIKNPLVSIKTFADLLPEKYDDEHFRYNYSMIVSKELSRINDLVTEMLNYVKRNDPVIEKFKPVKLLDDVLLLLSPQLEAGNVLVEKHYAEEEFLLDADYSLLKQALINICVNAIQAMAGGGTLKIGLKYLVNKSKIKEINENEPRYAEEKCEEICFIIEDTGIGIDKTISESIFDPFVTSKADGIGLGLSVSQKIVLAHRGKITFSQAEGGGTIFEVKLPVYDNLV